MRLIDDEGRLFGRVNAIDALAVLLLLAGDRRQQQRQSEGELDRLE